MLYADPADEPLPDASEYEPAAEFRLPITAENEPTLPVIVPTARFPWTCNVVPGFVVPIPTFPSFVTMKVVAEDEPIANAGAEPLLAVGLMES
jgi:hypothetical protein